MPSDNIACFVCFFALQIYEKYRYVILFQTIILYRTHVIITNNFINEFGDNEKFEFAKGTTILVNCGYSRRCTSEAKRVILEKYGKDILWVWVKRDGTAVLDRNRMNNVIKDCFVDTETEIKSYVKRPDENLYDTLPAAIVHIGGNPYIKYLNDSQSKFHKVLSFDEIRVVNKKSIVEKVYLFNPLAELTEWKKIAK